ncbi:FG-GAP repeat protein [Planctomycetes bacterium Pla163]|uniref:FG-GAP repeat protein n=1 Tax=Rohdeia mirabilis TaxID=2528008 RepID=A0A518CUU5_9BACT|nr:FG-GAP repeat protein [Planctomycetes bacterium Pla163]
MNHSPCLALFALVAGASTATAQSLTAFIDGLGGGSEGMRGLPELVLIGSPIPGNPFELSVANTVPGSLVLLGAGVDGAPFPLPEFDATLHVFLPLFVLATSTSGAAGRTAPLVGQSPLDPALAGASFFSQAVVVDTGATGSLAFTNGVRIGIGAGNDDATELFPGFASPFDREVIRMEVADLDGDGHVDVIATCESPNVVAVSLGRPNGRFDAPVDYDCGAAVQQLTIGDLDLDGNLDAITASGFLGVSVLRGLGDGTFAAPMREPNISAATNIALADVNGDGKIDAVTGRGNTLTAAVLLGDGTGGFTQVIDWGLTSTPSFVALEDIDSDGHIDAIFNSSHPDVELTVLFRVGGAIVGAPLIVIGSSAFSNAFELVDLNQDGFLDLVYFDPTEAVSKTGLKLRFGRGGGAFDPVVVIADGTKFYSLDVLDVDGDGILDLSGRPSKGGVSDADRDLAIFLKGNGDGTFQAPLVTEKSSGSHLSIVSVDADGVLDALVLRDSYLEVLPGNGDGSFGVDRRVVSDGEYSGLIAYGVDRTGDGLTDMIVQAGATETRLLVLDGHGSFAEIGVLSVPTRIKDPIVTDVNSDQHIDLVATLPFNDEVAVFLGDGAGGFDMPSTFSVVNEWGLGFEPTVLASGDLDGDGYQDLVTANRSSRDVSVLMGLGDGSFASARGFSIASTLFNGNKPADIALADFDRDGHLDVVTGNEMEFAVLFGNGSGSFGPAIEAAPASFANFVAPLDLDADGFVDLVGCVYGPTEAVVFCRGNGDGSFQAPVASPVSSIEGPVLTDFDGDGRIDYVVGGNFWKGVGDGTFESVGRFRSGLASMVSLAIDFDGDLLPDLVNVESGGGADSIVVLPNQLVGQ